MLRTHKTSFRVVAYYITSAVALEQYFKIRDGGITYGGRFSGSNRRRGEPAIQEECNMICGIYVSGAVITSGANLVAKYVIQL